MHGLAPARTSILAEGCGFYPGIADEVVLRFRPWTWDEFAFRDQLRLSLQSMPHIVPGQRTLIQIVEICPHGHFDR